MGMCQSMNVDSFIQKQQLSPSEVRCLSTAKLEPVKDKIIKKYDKSPEYLSWKQDITDFKKYLANYLFGGESVAFPIDQQKRIEQNVINGSYCIYLIINKTEVEKGAATNLENMPDLSDADPRTLALMNAMGGVFQLFFRDLKRQLELSRKLSKMVTSMEQFDVDPSQYGNYKPQESWIDHELDKDYRREYLAVEPFIDEVMNLADVFITQNIVTALRKENLSKLVKGLKEYQGELHKFQQHQILRFINPQFQAYMKLMKEKITSIQTKILSIVSGKNKMPKEEEQTPEQKMAISFIQLKNYCLGGIKIGETTSENVLV